ncbi:MAG TPA: DUF1566 domain-containing protein [Nitrospinota bacterium]|jgi:hypothetical protein|nr:DUF1566 domain-containing protein [Nitrospinota bacterium]|tara:strand:- start:3877 stop:4413 length:537 start_codon:yes stop_codon:yes gene_type:complete
MRKKYSRFFYNSLLPLFLTILFISTGFASHGIVAAFNDEAKKPESYFIDDGNGIVKDTRTGLMWTKMDSYADTGKCMNWNESKIYVSGLKTGGFSDWRMPEERELMSIYDKSHWSLISFDHHYPLHLDGIFADGAAYWYWVAESADSNNARTINFLDGFVTELNRDRCSNLGVRAVRH